MEKKYGLWTSIAMVVGVVIGSGVFFKADDVLTLTKGNVLLALAAWVIGAISMVFGALVFSEFAARIQNTNGIVDYSEAAYGPRFGYLVGWFNGVVYYMPLSAILAWVASLYTQILLGNPVPDNSPATWGLAAVYMLAVYGLNMFAPVLSGRFQVTTTAIKLIPLTLIAIVGLIAGLSNGVMTDNIAHAASSISGQMGTLASAVVACAFAYEGWIVATTINNEIKDAKKNLPKALVIGSLIVFAVYVLYFLGVASVLPTETIMSEGNNSVNLAATQLFGQFAGTLLTVFVVVSCLGTLNGLILSSIRMPYALAVRGQGPMPKTLSKIHLRFGMPLYSSCFALVLTALYLLTWYGSLNNWFGKYIGLDEIPIVLIYGFYLFLYFWYMKTYKDLTFFKRFVVPGLATAGSLVILYGGLTNPSIGIYLIVSITIILLGLLFYRAPEKSSK